MVNLGLRATLQPNSVYSKGLPNLICQVITDPRRLSPEDLEKDFHDWIVANAFREIFEHFASQLDLARDACALLKFASRSQAAPLSDSDVEIWKKQDLAAARKFHRQFIPQKLKRLKKDYSQELGTDFEPHIDSLGRARNCYVHRHGIVAEGADCEAGRQLEVTWVGVRVEGAIDKKSLSESEDGDFRGLYFVGSEIKKKKFNIGEKISFSPREFNEIILTVFAFGKSLADQIVEYARSILGYGFERRTLDELREGAEFYLLFDFNVARKGGQRRAIKVEWRDGRLRFRSSTD